MLVAVSGLRLVISWEASLSQAPAENLALLLPPIVAELLSCKTVCDQAEIVLATRGQSAIARLTDQPGKLRLALEIGSRVLFGTKRTRLYPPGTSCTG